MAAYTSMKNCRITMEMSLTETVIGGGFSNGGIHNDKEHGDAQNQQAQAPLQKDIMDQCVGICFAYVYVHLP